MSFWGMLTGKNARKDLDKGIAAVSQGQQQAADAYTTYGNQAKGYQQPYYDQGTKAFTLANDYAGVNGESARDAANKLWLGNDALAQARDLNLKRTGQVANAGGGYNSGTRALADSRVLLEDLNNERGRVTGLGQQGQAAANALSGIDQNTGAGIAGSYQNAGAQTANLYGQRAQTQNALGQNILGAAGVAASFFGAPNANRGVNRLG